MQKIYVSTEFFNFDELSIDNDGMLFGILMRKINYGLPFWVIFKNGDWVIINLKPSPILTEKLNAKIYLWIMRKSDNNKRYKNYAEISKKYTITKFMLLKEIIKMNDIISVIVSLSD